MAITPSSRTALLLGATGLVGRECLALLLADPAFTKVIAWTRRPLADSHPKLVNTVFDFSRLEDHASQLTDVTDVFCCLGTTRKKAGSAEAFVAVDHDLPLRTARMAAANGAKRFFLISAVGANAASPLLYPKTKGRLEQALQELPFERLRIFRPSFLDGDRPESRPAEQFAIALLRPIRGMLRGPLAGLRPIPASVVAQAMIRSAHGDSSDRVKTYESDELEKLGRISKDESP